MSLEGRKYSVASGRFQGAKFHRLLSGDEFEEMAVASASLSRRRQLREADAQETFEVTGSGALRFMHLLAFAQC